MVPIGTIIGAYFLIFSLTRKRQFLNRGEIVESS
jgi:hypothetical protein